MHLLLPLIAIFLFAAIFRKKKSNYMYKRYAIAALLVISSLLFFRFGQFFVALGVALFPIAIHFIKAIISNRFITHILAKKFHKASEQQCNVSSRNATMTRVEAAEILGVTTDTTKDEVTTKYKLLMKRNHPDAGGSEKIATLLNQAKETLLN